MQVSLRILLFVLCIHLASFCFANDQGPSASAVAVQSPLSNEILEKNYVSLELNAQEPLNFSILKTMASILRVLENKAYSLLNWRMYSRRILEVANYDRVAAFGRWINDPADETCYNTRALVLMRDSRKPVVYKDEDKCSVESGLWNDPYTGKAFRATTDIQIDHFVPLKNAYVSGAHAWSFRARCLYANFLGSKFHLVSVNGTENMRKGDKSPERYMPPNKGYTCTYLKNWLSIKFLWGLKMTVAEANGITDIIRNNNCDVRQFNISQREILTQAQFVRDNLDLCEKIDAARSSAGIPVAH